MVMAFASCSGSGGGDGGGGGGGGAAGSAGVSTLAVKGSLGAAFAMNKPMKWYDRIIALVSFSGNLYAGPDSVDKIVAVPVDHSFSSNENLIESAITIDINPDKSFTINLDRTKRWVLLLVNSTASWKNRVVAFAALGDTNNLVLLPLDNATSNIELGNLSKSGSDAVESGSLIGNTASFSTNISKLREVAQMSCMTKVIKNMYQNHVRKLESGGEYYYSWTDHNWMVNSAGAENSFTNPSLYTYKGYQPTFRTEKYSEISFSGIYDKDYTVSITAPAAVSPYGGGGPFTVFDNTKAWDGSRTRPGEYAVTLDATPPKFAIMYFSQSDFSMLSASGAGYYFTNNVVGNWLLRKNASELSAFDLDIVKPISGGNPLPYMPSLKIVYDATSGLVERFEIKWYMYNFNTSTYDEVSDFSEFDKIVAGGGRANLNIFDYSDNSRVLTNFKVQALTQINAEANWYFFGSGKPSPNHNLSAIRIEYEIFGICFSIDVRP